MNWQSAYGIALVLAAGLHSGCALTGKADALSPRYFSPEQVATSQRAPNPQ